MKKAEIPDFEPGSVYKGATGAPRQIVSIVGIWCYFRRDGGASIRRCSLDTFCQWAVREITDQQVTAQRAA